MDLTAIRARLATGLTTLTPSMVYQAIPANPPVVPAGGAAFVISPAPGQFADVVTMDGAEDLDLVVTVLVQRVSDVISTPQIDSHLAGPAAAAIDSGPTADWDYAVSSPARGYGTYAWGEGEGTAVYLGFEIPVHVGVSP